MDQAPGYGETWPGRRDLLAALLLAGLLALAGGSRLYAGVCGQHHDDAIYVMTARALAEGDGYRLTNLPGSPPQTKYPLLYPALLALGWKTGLALPQLLVAFQLLSLATAAAFLGLSYLFLVRFGYAARPVALAAGLSCATAYTFVSFSTLIMSEMLFGLLLVAALWWLEAALRRPGEGRLAADFLGGVLLALPFLCRSVGVPLIPLGLLLLGQSGRRWRGAAAGAAAVALPWLLWALLAAGACKEDPVQGYYTDYLGWWLSFGPPGMARVIASNAGWIITGTAAFGLEGISELLKANGLARAWLLLFFPLGLVALGMLLGDVRKGRVLATFVAAYLVLVSVWPWMPHRFLIPLLPFLGVYLLRGAGLLGRLVPRRAAPVLGWGLVAAALLANVSVVGRAAWLRHRHDLPFPDLGDEAYAWSCNRRLFAWLKENSASDDVLAAGSDTMLALFTGRKAYYPLVCPPLSLFYGLDSPALIDPFAPLEGRRPRFVVLTPCFHGAEAFRAWMDELRRRAPARVVLRYQDPDDPRFVVYEILYPS